MSVGNIQTHRCVWPPHTPHNHPPTHTRFWCNWSGVFPGHWEFWRLPGGSKVQPKLRTTPHISGRQTCTLSGSPARPVKTRTAAPSPTLPDSAHLGQGLRICISNNFPDDADVADRGTSLRTPVPVWTPLTICPCPLQNNSLLNSIPFLTLNPSN